jgi:hypothetical protein
LKTIAGKGGLSVGRRCHARLVELIIELEENYPSISYICCFFALYVGRLFVCALDYGPI